jgi:predicted transcriptional regulator
LKEKFIDDFEKYISKRKRIDKTFAKELNIHKSTISIIENHSEDIRLSTLKEYLEAVLSPNNGVRSGGVWE